MPRTLLLVLLSLSALAGKAQSWCPPGATWTYNAGMYLQGYHQLTYVGDTLIGGEQAQVIDQYSAVQFPLPDPPYWTEPQISYSPVAMITRTEDDVVSLWQDNQWDTLYWFGASIGDHWYAPHVTDTTCAPFVVQDTGTTVFDGVPLRWIELESWYRVYERIGSTWDIMLFCPNWLIDGPTGMRCYSDDQITFSAPGWNYGCNSMAGIGDAEAARELLIHPNPGSEHLTLSLPVGSHIITLFDAIGCIVLEERVSGERTTISTAHLPAGVYFVRIDKSLPTTRWVKQ